MRKGREGFGSAICADSRVVKGIVLMSSAGRASASDEWVGWEAG